MSPKTKGKVEVAKQALTVHLPDTRGVTISRWGRGNTKLGMDGMYTYSRLPGRIGGTCPGASLECQNICYAKRVHGQPVWDVWARNSLDLTGDDVYKEPLPPDAKIVRIHVSGDFDSRNYVQHWIKIVLEHPDVLFFGYTRSWRVPELLKPLERLRALPNVELFASMDQSIQEMPPPGWRRAWIEGDSRAEAEQLGDHGYRAQDGAAVYTCPEETGRKSSCQECGYCILGRRSDVRFLLH